MNNNVKPPVKQRQTPKEQWVTIGISVVVVLVIILLFKSCHFSDTVRECPLCGEQKLCHSYDCQKPKGINAVGKMTYSHETKIICEDCADKLRHNGTYTNVTQH